MTDKDERDIHLTCTYAAYGEEAVVECLGHGELLPWTPKDGEEVLYRAAYVKRLLKVLARHGIDPNEEEV